MVLKLPIVMLPVFIQQNDIKVLSAVGLRAKPVPRQLSNRKRELFYKQYNAKNGQIIHANDEK